MFLSIQLSKIHVQFSRGFSYAPSNQFLSIQTCISLLQSCAQKQELSKGRKLHARILLSGHLDSPISATSLINMYAKCNSISNAVSVFNSTLDVHNVFVYNAIISGLVSNNMPGEAFEYFCRMRSIGLPPDKFTFPCVIKACSSAVDLKKIHSLLFKHELSLDVFVGSALVHSYLKFELISDALQLFENLPVRDDIVLLNSMINGYVQIGAFVKALDIFRRTASMGLVPNTFTVTGLLSALALAGEVYNGKSLHGFVVKMGYYSIVEILNALIDMYGKCGHLSDARVLFENMVDKDIYSWNSIISVHEQCGDHGESLKLLKWMIKSGLRPDLVTATAAIPACARLSALMHGREIHCYMIVNGLDKGDNTFTDNAIMDMYTKCGSLREARLIFDGIMVKHVASWNIMIMGYGTHGFGNEALDLFSRMCDAGFKPDEASFVGVLAACSHAGFVSRGRQLLAEMQPQYGVTPAIDHYACVIDMVGRAGKLEESLELILNMPIKPNEVVWTSFLAACQLHGNADLAKIAAQRAIEIDPEHCGNYVLMSNVYMAAGRYEEVAETRHTMMQQCVKKSPGCSWIELGDGMHVFYNGDYSHPEKNLVYDGIDSLTACLQEHAYVLDVMES